MIILRHVSIEPFSQLFWGETGLKNWKKYNRQESHALFNNTFPNGFAFEVLKVFSPPPKVGFSWRHWGKSYGKRSFLITIIFSWLCRKNDREWFVILGTYKETQGDGQTVNVYGFAIANVNEKLQIENIEVPDIIFSKFPTLGPTGYYCLMTTKYIRDEVYYDQAEFMRTLQARESWNLS